MLSARLEYIISELFEQADERRLNNNNGIKPYYERAYPCFREHNTEAIERMQKRLLSLPEKLDWFDSMKYAAELTCLKLYYRENDPKRLAELIEETADFIRNRKKYYGNIAVLYHRRLRIPKKEFLEALERDLRFIERYESSKNPKIKENKKIKGAAAGRVGSILEFSKFFPNFELSKESLVKYQDLYQYWIENP